MLVAAHNYDLIAARGCGLRTCFVPRITEYGPHQKEDFEAISNWDFVVADINDLADQLGC
jgi:2-haloacid dehalogenase